MGRLLCVCVCRWFRWLGGESWKMEVKDGLSRCVSSRSDGLQTDAKRVLLLRAARGVGGGHWAPALGAAEQVRAAVWSGLIKAGATLASVAPSGGSGLTEPQFPGWVSCLTGLLLLLEQMLGPVPQHISLLLFSCWSQFPKHTNRALVTENGLLLIWLHCWKVWSLCYRAFFLNYADKLNYLFWTLLEIKFFQVELSCADDYSFNLLKKLRCNSFANNLL